MLGVNQMTQTTGNVFRRDIWSKELTRAFEANLVLANKVSRFDSESQNAKSVFVPNLSNLEALDKIANTSVTLQSPSETGTTLLLNKHKHVAFVIEDALKVQQNYNLMSEYTNKAGYALKKALDTDIANLATGFSQTSGTYNTTITTAAVLSAVQLLDDADVPQTDRVWVLKPHAVNDLRTISDYTRFDGTGYAGAQANGAIGNGSGGRENGLVGLLYNAPVYMSTQVYASSTSISNLYIHKEAIALGIQQEVRVQSDNRIDYLGTLVVADLMYGMIERRNEAGVEFKN